MAKANDTGAPAPTQPTVADNIDRHLKGERVTDQYLNLETGEIETVPGDQELEFVQIPFLGVANANEVPITEPGGRATELLELGAGYLGEPVRQPILNNSAKFPQSPSSPTSYIRHFSIHIGKALQSRLHPVA